MMATRLYVCPLIVMVTAGRFRHRAPPPALRGTCTLTGYADKLGFTTGQEGAAALLYRRGEDRLFLPFSSPGAGTAQHQLAAWVVEDLQTEVAELRARG